MDSETSVQDTKKDITITYETLFELLRREKNREELQELHKTFFEDVAQYVQEKQQIIANAEQKSDIFSSVEREKTTTQLANIRRILKEIYERREKKIITMALNKSRTGSNIIDTSAMLPVEKKFFDNLVDVLNKARDEMLFAIFRKNLQQNVQQQEPKPPKKKMKLIRFIKAVPKFVGKELEVYGPFEEEDIASLPAEIADVIISKGRAEEID